MNRKFRKKINDLIQSESPEDIDLMVGNVHRDSWRKASDTPLGEIVFTKRLRFVERWIEKAASNDPSVSDRLFEFLTDANIEKPRGEAIMRQVRSSIIERYPCLELASDDLDLLTEFIRSLD